MPVLLTLSVIRPKITPVPPPGPHGTISLAVRHGNSGAAEAGPAGARAMTTATPVAAKTEWVRILCIVHLPD